LTDWEFPSGTSMQKAFHDQGGHGVIPSAANSASSM